MNSMNLTSLAQSMLYEHFTSIYIYVRVVRPVFSVYSGSSIDLIVLGYPGNLMFAAVRVFKVSTRICTIKNKMAEGFLETLTQTRELSSSYLRAARALLRSRVSL